MSRSDDQALSFVHAILEVIRESSPKPELIVRARSLAHVIGPEQALRVIGDIGFELSDSSHPSAPARLGRLADVVDGLQLDVPETSSFLRWLAALARGDAEAALAHHPKDESEIRSLLRQIIALRDDLRPRIGDVHAHELEVLLVPSPSGPRARIDLFLHSTWFGTEDALDIVSQSIAAAQDPLREALIWAAERLRAHREFIEKERLAAARAPALIEDLDRRVAEVVASTADAAHLFRALEQAPAPTISPEELRAVLPILAKRDFRTAADAAPFRLLANMLIGDPQFADLAGFAADAMRPLADDPSVAPWRAQLFESGSRAEPAVVPLDWFANMHLGAARALVRAGQAGDPKRALAHAASAAREGAHLNEPDIIYRAEELILGSIRTSDGLAAAIRQARVFVSAQDAFASVAEVAIVRRIALIKLLIETGETSHLEEANRLCKEADEIPCDALFPSVAVIGGTLALIQVTRGETIDAEEVVSDLLEAIEKIDSRSDPDGLAHAVLVLCDLTRASRDISAEKTLSRVNDLLARVGPRIAPERSAGLLLMRAELRVEAYGREARPLALADVDEAQRAAPWALAHDAAAIIRARIHRACGELDEALQILRSASDPGAAALQLEVLLDRGSDADREEATRFIDRLVSSWGSLRDDRKPPVLHAIAHWLRVLACDYRGEGTSERLAAIDLISSQAGARAYDLKLFLRAVRSRSLGQECAREFFAELDQVVAEATDPDLRLERSILRMGFAANAFGRQDDRAQHSARIVEYQIRERPLPRRARSIDLLYQLIELRLLAVPAALVHVEEAERLWLEAEGLGVPAQLRPVRLQYRLSIDIGKLRLQPGLDVDHCLREASRLSSRASTFDVRAPSFISSLCRALRYRRHPKLDEYAAKLESEYGVSVESPPPSAMRTAEERASDIEDAFREVERCRDLAVTDLANAISRCIEVVRQGLAVGLRDHVDRVVKEAERCLEREDLFAVSSERGQLLFALGIISREASRRAVLERALAATPPSDVPLRFAIEVSLANVLRSSENAAAIALYRNALAVGTDENVGPLEVARASKCLADALIVAGGRSQLDEALSLVTRALERRHGELVPTLRAEALMTKARIWIELGKLNAPDAKVAAREAILEADGWVRAEDAPHLSSRLAKMRAEVGRPITVTEQGERLAKALRARGVKLEPLPRSKQALGLLAGGSFAKSIVFERLTKVADKVRSLGDLDREHELCLADLAADDLEAAVERFCAVSFTAPDSSPWFDVIERLVERYSEIGWPLRLIALVRLGPSFGAFEGDLALIDSVRQDTDRLRKDAPEDFFLEECENCLARLLFHCSIGEGQRERWKEAEAIWGKNLEVARKRRDAQGEAILLLNLAALHLGLGRDDASHLDEAIRLYERIEALRGEIDEETTAKAFVGRAWAKIQLPIDRQPSAIDTALRELEVAQSRAGQEPTLIASIELHRGLAWKEKARIDAGKDRETYRQRAGEAFDRAGELYTALEDRVNVARTLHNLGVLGFEGRWDAKETIEILKRALAARVGRAEEEIETLRALFSVRRSLERFDDLDALLLEHLDRLCSEPLSLASVNMTLDPFWMRAELLTSRSDIDARTVDAIERGQREAERLLAAHADLEARYVANRWLGRFSALRVVVGARLGETAESLLVRSARSPMRFSLELLQQRLISRPGTALIDIHVSLLGTAVLIARLDSSGTMSLTAQSLRLTEGDAQRWLEHPNHSSGLLQIMRDIPSKPAIEDFEAADVKLTMLLIEIYEKLLGPVTKKLLRTGIRHLAISLSGFLAALPIVAATEPAPKLGYLIEQFDSIRVVSSLSTFVSAPEEAPPVRERVISIAYDAEDATRDQAKRMSPLHAAIVERGAELTIRDEAMSPDILLEMIRDCDTAIIACHGTFDENDLARCGLKIGKDALLTARALMDCEPPLQCRLVVLDACHSARTREDDFGAVWMGLSGAFLRAGAHEVVAALWDVFSSPTDDLFLKFEQHRVRGRSAAEALGGAMRELIQWSRDPRFDIATCPSWLGTRPFGERERLAKLAGSPIFWAGLQILTLG